MLAVAMGLSVCGRVASAQVFPPPTIFASSNQTFSDGQTTLAYQFPNSFSFDLAGRLIINAQALRTGATTNEPVVVIADGSLLASVGNRGTFGASLLPPTTQQSNLFTSRASLSGNVLISVSAGGEQSVLLKAVGQPLRAITDLAQPAAGLLALSTPVMTTSLGTWIALQDSISGDLWIGDAALPNPIPFSRVYLRGMPAPGFPSGFTTADNPGLRALTASGAFAYTARIAGPGVVSNSNDIVLFTASSAATALTPVLRMGDPAPGVADGTFYSFLGASTDFFGFSSSGELCLTGQVTSPTRNGRAVFAGGPGPITAIATCGPSTLPGVSGRINDLQVHMSPGGRKVFWAGVEPSGSSSGTGTSALFTGSLAQPTVLVRSSQPAPGLPLGTTLGRIREFMINDLGLVVFRAHFSASPAHPLGGTAIFGCLGSTGPFLVVGPGSTISLGSLGMKTVSENSSVSGSPILMDFSQTGTVALQLGFTDGSAALIGRNIDQVFPPPLGFQLTSPVPNVQSVPTSPTLTWTPSANADLYAVLITPENGQASSFTTTSTSFVVPAGLLQECQNVTWGVVATNASGPLASTPVAQSFTTFSLGCDALPVYSIQSIGLDSTDYGGPTISHVTPEGRVGGFNVRSSSFSTVGQDAWIWDGQMSPPLGLHGVEYGGDTGPAANRLSSIVAINAQGRAVGSSHRFSGNQVVGLDPWYYSGSTSALIGLRGPGYDRTPGLQTTFRNGVVSGLNSSGIATGSTVRYSPVNASKLLGRDAWRSDGTTTELIGLFGPGYDFDNAGEAHHDVNSVAINASGAILGTTQRWYNTSPSTASSLGMETWLQSGAAITLVRITGAEFELQTPNGLQRGATGKFLNDAGQVAGTVARRNLGGDFAGLGAFRWDAGAFQIIDPPDAVHMLPPTGARAPTVMGMSAAGYVVGESRRYDSNGADLGTDVWFFDGMTTRLIGLTGPEFQTPAAAPDAAATKRHHFGAMNAAGQVVGRTEYLPLGTDQPVAGWVFDPATGQTTILTGPPGAVGVGTTLSINDRGGVMGTFNTRSLTGGFLSSTFIWSAFTGMRALDSRVLGGLAAHGWNGLPSVAGGAGVAPHDWSDMIVGVGGTSISTSRRGYVMTWVPPPGGFALLAPDDGAAVGSARPVLTWGACPGATLYSVSLTPVGGATTTVQTGATSLQLPAALASTCEHIAWSVIATGPAGTSPSVPASRTFVFRAADYNLSGDVAVQDIFDFLDGWFAGDSRADINLSGGLEPQDLFDFLAAWFQGCP